MNNTTGVANDNRMIWHVKVHKRQWRNQHIVSDMHISDNHRIAANPDIVPECWRPRTLTPEFHSNDASLVQRTIGPNACPTIYGDVVWVVNNKPRTYF